VHVEENNFNTGGSIGKRPGVESRHKKRQSLPEPRSDRALPGAGGKKARSENLDHRTGRLRRKEKLVDWGGENTDFFRPTSFCEEREESEGHLR